MRNRNAGAFRALSFGIGHNSPLYDSRFTDHDSRAFDAPMHLDFANLLNLVSTITLIGALVFTGLQVRAANRSRHKSHSIAPRDLTFLLTLGSGLDRYEPRITHRGAAATEI